MRFLVLTPVALLAAITLGACGASEREASDESHVSTTSSTTPDVPRPLGRLDNASPCRGTRTSAGPLRTSTDLAGARDLVLDAARRATRTGHRFAVELEVVSGRLGAEAIVFGRRTPTNASSALVVWSGAAGAVLPDVGMRIVDDQLYLQPGNFGSPWRRAGSASGVSLDVGRELLDHPFLLRVANARREQSSATVTFTAPAAHLREYATSERRGPVTDLLRQARQLTLVAHVRGGRLVGDRFSLVTTVPASLRLGAVPAGTPIRIAGTSSYCRLRLVDRPAITAPRVTDRRRVPAPAG